MGILKQNHQVSTLNEKEILIAKSLYHVNQLSPYPINDFRLEEWAISINEIVPNLEINDLVLIINFFKTGGMPYNTNLGIQNIFSALLAKFNKKYSEEIFKYKFSQNNNPSN